MSPLLPLYCCLPPLPDLWSLERPRFCLLSKEKGGSFGFHLRQELAKAVPVVCRVEPGTSAQHHGLREGDRVLGVNGHVVEHEDYASVLRRIRASGPRVLLTVVAQHVYDAVQARQGNSAHLSPELGSGVRPRLCHIVKDEGGFGFSVTFSYQGPFWLVLSAGGAAERAGVPPGARLLEVNGVSVDKLTYNQLNRKALLSPTLSASFPGLPGQPASALSAQLVDADALLGPLQLWQSGEQVTLLVAGPEVEEQCHRLGVPLAAPLAEGWALPTKPRLLHLQKGPQGFGFLLREEKGLDGQPGQFLWEVDPGLPAEKAGMQAGDRLVAVAGESVEGLGHEETVSRIQAQGSSASLTVVDPEADRFFSMENCSASLVETKDLPVEDTTTSLAPCGSRQCFLYPGPGGGYGFRLTCVAREPRLFISQVTGGGSAARAGLQMGDVILEVNGCPLGGENDVEKLQQLVEAEPPLCLKLAARAPQGFEASTPPGLGEDWAPASELL
ncbi:Na(+)/H(+) exchange regulatory cofactor NHE-RF4 isoform X2 [Suricata suricatta]|uniref:Na(+)/H(+) exchange regulatory cofactor NHE-RF4 isoform X2 n=1 Tax=Suricata suricatta TaxID=37032 RepID=UPI00115671F9|nr:Na(+)/H(+) exchange regulatory cofactor NHE-RF4 isoform X2 [Suricata suricatta]